jgi:uncharacterized repeat protein (TIGR03803 family)
VTQGTSLRQFVKQSIRALSVLVAMITLVLMSATVVRAQTLTTLYSFCDRAGCPNGNYPSGVLAQALNGDLYGTTRGGGAYSGFSIGGTVFKIAPSGAFRLLYSFCAQSGCPDGTGAEGLTLATNGNLYGTTYSGGAVNGGTIFDMTPSGTLTTLLSFCYPNCADGVYPVGNLVQSADGYLYGVISRGGVDVDPNLGGLFYKITPTGTLTTLYTFCVGGGTLCPDGEDPFSGVVQGTDGNFYGTTGVGGAYDYSGGTVFKMTPNGTLTTLYTFSQEDPAGGIYPQGPLVLAANGDLYGTTSAGGSEKGGTVFKLTPSGTFTTLYNFSSAYGSASGDYPVLYLQASDGNLYGTTGESGIYLGGTVFKITPSGTFTTLYSFCAKKGCADGEDPTGLIQGTDGNLYGTTAYGGIDGAISGADVGGTVFRLSVGLDPFVKPLTTSGKVGKAVTILGTDLTGATSVTFNGTSAAFTVLSPSAIEATVPAGATTGKVVVTTASGSVSSILDFHILQ